MQTLAPDFFCPLTNPQPYQRDGAEPPLAAASVTNMENGFIESKCASRRPAVGSSDWQGFFGMFDRFSDTAAAHQTMRSGSPGSILPAVKNREQNVLKTAQLQQATSGDYLVVRAARRFAGTTLRCLVTGFLVSAASNNCRNPCANRPTAFPKAPSCPTRTIATDRCRSNDGGRNTFTGSIE